MRAFVIAGVVAVAGAAWVISRGRDAPSRIPAFPEDKAGERAREGVPMPNLRKGIRPDGGLSAKEASRRDTFAMVPVEASRAIAMGGRYDGIAITSTTLDVLVTLIRLTDRRTGRGVASYGHIAERASCGKTSVVRHMRVLDAHFGYIRRATSHKINPSLNTMTAWTLAGVVQSVVCRDSSMRKEVASDESPLVTLPYDSSKTTSSSSSTDLLNSEGGAGVQDDDPPTGDLYDQMRAKHGAAVDEMLAVAEKDPKVNRSARGFVAAAFRDGYHETYMANAPAAPADDGGQYHDERIDLYWKAHEAGLIADFSFNGHRAYTVEELAAAIKNGTVLGPVEEETASPDVDVPQWWETAMDQIRLQFDRATFDTFLRDAVFLRDEGERVVVQSRNAYARDMCQHRLYRNIQRLCEDVRGEPVAIEFVTPTPAPHPGLPQYMGKGKE